VKAILFKHVAFFRAERLAYYLKQIKAELNSDECISLIIDGADQSHMVFPYFRVRVTTTVPAPPSFSLAPPSSAVLG